MGTKTKELDRKPGGKEKRSSCTICNPGDRIPHWKVWNGQYKLNDGVRV